MSDLSEGITALLNDPKSMEQFKALAGAFLQSAGNKANGPAAAENAYSQNRGNSAPDGGINIDPEVLKTLAGTLSGLSGGLSSFLPGGDSGFDLGAMMKILNILKTNVSDDRAQLLLALRPHLSEERRHRVDKAVKILKLVSLVPIFKEQGLLNF